MVIHARTTKRPERPQPSVQNVQMHRNFCAATLAAGLLARRGLQTMTVDLGVLKPRRRLHA